MDVVSAIEFDDSGDYIAVGDRGGRIVLFDRGNNSKADKSAKKTSDYKLYPLL